MNQSRSSKRPESLKPGSSSAVSVRFVVPAGSPSWVTEELVEQTLKTWQPYYSHQLIESDALEMIMGVDQLFGVVSRDKSNEKIRSTGKSQQS